MATKTKTAEQTDEKDVKQVIREICNNASGHAMPPCKDDAEVQARCAMYIDRCKERATMLPTCEAFALYLGATFWQLRKWKNGTECSADRKEAVQGVITWISIVWLDARQKGIVKPADFIWYSKQWFEMREPDVHAVLELNDPRKELPPAESIADKYLEDVGIKGLPKV